MKLYSVPPELTLHSTTTPDGKTIMDLQELVELIENNMTKVETNPWSVAIDLEIIETLDAPPETDIPF